MEKSNLFFPMKVAPPPAHKSPKKKKKGGKKKSKKKVKYYFLDFTINIPHRLKPLHHQTQPR